MEVARGKWGHWWKEINTSQGMGVGNCWLKLNHEQLRDLKVIKFSIFIN